MKAPIGFLAALLFSLTSGGCAAQTPGKSAVAPPPAPHAQESGNATNTPYVIGPLDVLNVQVWNDPKVSGFVDVRPDGMISMQLIGEVRADGLTVPELTKLIKEKLSAVMNDPEVNIQPTRINSRKVYILGGVNHQGEMPLTGNMTVLDAISNCGGFKDFANPKKIYVLRRDKKFNFNYKDVSRGRHMEQNIVLESGDHIFVPE